MGYTKVPNRGFYYSALSFSRPINFQQKFRKPPNFRKRGLRESFLLSSVQKNSACCYTISKAPSMSTLAAISIRTATRRRYLVSLSRKFSIAATGSSSHDHRFSSGHHDVDATPSAAEILISSAKSSDANSFLQLEGSDQPIKCGQIPRAPGMNALRANASRHFSSAASSGESNAHHDRPPVTSFSADELMVRDLCRQWGDEVLRPVVRDMDEEGRTYTDIIQGLFDCGLMGMVRRLLGWVDTCLFFCSAFPLT